MGSGKNLKQKKNKRSREVLGMMERIYSGAQYLEKERELRKCKGIIRGIWEKDEYGSEEARKVRHSRRKRFQKERITREIYSKNAVWIGWWKIWGGVLEEVRE